ncbi:hypothetical protein Q0Z83_044730 [Actinoplanes sichuanensis]|uniref:hypothetical protein n=1 Tax=Actinoplanes sichuanensis TaxID=512349 RepID=UPI0029529C0A|nr:hypothetical protein [Actinoplanes sichuanensis]BEL06282.1 hypothetical protein Q0Z83_044730 [Actinoplanes sichuanensis]
MVLISEEDRLRLRCAPAFRRSVWALRLLAFFPAVVIAIFVLAVLRVPLQVAEVIAYVAFVACSIGVGLGAISRPSLERVKNDVLDGYDLSPYERAMLLNVMLVRAAVGKYREPTRS